MCRASRAFDSSTLRPLSLFHKRHPDHLVQTRPSLLGQPDALLQEHAAALPQVAFAEAVQVRLLCDRLAQLPRGDEDLVDPCPPAEACVVALPAAFAPHKLPAAVAPIVEAVKHYERLTIEAAATGSRECARAALAANPLIPDAGLADRLLDALEVIR